MAGPMNACSRLRREFAQADLTSNEYADTVVNKLKHVGLTSVLSSGQESLSCYRPADQQYEYVL